jgi:frataxin-like iron-binding protein CyaY
VKLTLDIPFFKHPKIEGAMRVKKNHQDYKYFKEIYFFKFIIIFFPIILFVSCSKNESPLWNPPDIENFTHEPEGALSHGIETMTETQNGVFQFTFKDPAFLTNPKAEQIIYQIDTNTAQMQKGLLQVEELVSGSMPLFNGGLSFYKNITNSAQELSQISTIKSKTVEADWANNKLKISFIEELISANHVKDKIQFEKSYTIWLKGKVLKIEFSSPIPPAELDQFNYNGVNLGLIKNVNNSSEVFIPYMGSIPIVKFKNQENKTLYVSRFFDWYKSNGSEIVSVPPASLGGNAFRFAFEPRYFFNDKNKLLAPVNETLNVLVSQKIEDHFIGLPFSKSPYYDSLSNKMIILVSALYPDSYSSYQQHFAALKHWGLNDLGVIFFQWEKYGLNLLNPERDIPSPIGALPSSLNPGMGSIKVGPSQYKNGFIIDPNDPVTKEKTISAFKKLTSQLDADSVPFALYQDSGSADPHGYSNQYPINEFLWMPGWTDFVTGLPVGLVAPTSNSSYMGLEDYFVRDANSVPKGGWDTKDNLYGSSWNQSGHPLHIISPTHLSKIHEAETKAAHQLFSPQAMFVDARTEVPEGLSIDQVSTSDRAKTIRNAILDSQRAMLKLKEKNAGPLWGENSYYRSKQWDSFESGLWDGRHRHLGLENKYSPQVGDDPNATNFQEKVIPDYELKHVLPKASSHLGMGFEPLHMYYGQIKELQNINDYPFDFDIDSKTHVYAFLDSWWTNNITFGHSAFASSNGHVHFNYRTMEGFIREYYLTTPIQAKQRESSIESVKYHSKTGEGLVSLDRALELNIDFKNPRIRLKFYNGLEIFVNHQDDMKSVELWNVTTQNGLNFDIPSNGFVASDQNGLLIFSALNPTTKNRIEYADVPGKWRMICTRGKSFLYEQFQGFPSLQTIEKLHSAVSEGEFSQVQLTKALAHTTIIENYEEGFVLAASGGVWDYQLKRFVEGSVVRTKVDSTLMSQAGEYQLKIPRKNIQVGQKMGLMMTHTLKDRSGKKHQYPFTGRAITYSVDPADLAKIDSWGVLSALKPGKISVTAKFKSKTGNQTTEKSVSENRILIRP